MMRHVIWEPAADLREFFSAYHFIDNDSEDGLQFPVKAGPKTALAFFMLGSFHVKNNGGSAPVPAYSLVGPVLSMYTLVFPAGYSAIVIAEFSETGCYEVLGEHPGGILNANKDISGAIPRGGVDALQGLAVNRFINIQEKVMVLEGVLRAIVCGKSELLLLDSERVRAIERAVVLVKNDVDSISVTGVASAMKVSVRTLERNFRSIMGLSPKQYIDLVRFTKIFHLYYEDRESFAEIFANSSYYDQSHIIKKFRQYAGFSPGTARKSPFQFASGLSFPFARALVEQSDNRKKNP